VQHKSLAVNFTVATCGNTRGSPAIHSLRPVPASGGRLLPKPRPDAILREAQGDSIMESPEWTGPVSLPAAPPLTAKDS
jgi:hypothetical protein